MIINGAYGDFKIGGDGELKDTGYDAVNRQSKSRQDVVVKRGANLRIAFQATSAPPPIAASPMVKVSLVQIVQDNITVTDATGMVTYNAFHGFQPNQVLVLDGTADHGTRVDQQFYRGNALVNTDPRYAQERVNPAAKMITQNPKKGDVKVSPGIDGETAGGTPSGGWAGERNSYGFTLAMLRDEPGATAKTGAAPDVIAGDMQFEIAVLFETKATAVWGDAIRWGFTINPAGQAATTPITLVPGGPSARFVKAVNAWNLAQIPDQPNGHHLVGLMPLP